jgi:CRISPR-associated endonuclease/helicase Cas3
VIFLYPTRATATEGFKDYVAWAPEGRLLTGTSRLDLQGILRNPPESMVGKTYPNEEEDRLFALGNWRIPFFSATLDQFLSFLEHGYGGLCRLPQLADSALILDEAHSLDNRLFERLCALLLHFRLPVLLLSASLPRERIRKLQEVGVRVFPDGAEREAYPALLSEEERPRYRMSRCEDVASALQSALASEQEAARSTLWVVNTVRRCQELALRLRVLGVAPLVYHSRFTLRDRRKQHQAVVQAFQNPDGTRPWAVTTQICEMSLDLDADRMVTEDVPLPSLIQRMGRSNRSRSRDTSFRAQVITYPPGDGRPYDLEPGGAAAVAGMRRFAEATRDRELAQGELTRSLQNPRYAPDAPLPAAWASFLCETWFASTEPLRGEEGDLDARCVLTTDLEHGLGPRGMPGDPDKDPLEAWVLCVPRRFVLKDRPLPEWLETRGLGLADGSRYHPDLGFLLFDPE